MSPAALVELEEKAQELVDLELVGSLVDQIYGLDVSDWNDESLALLEHLINQTIALLEAVPNESHRVLLTRLAQAREGVEQGVSPDPSKRPSIEDMRAFVSAHLS